MHDLQFSKYNSGTHWNRCFAYFDALVSGTHSVNLPLWENMVRLGLSFGCTSGIYISPSKI